MNELVPEHFHNWETFTCVGCTTLGLVSSTPFKSEKGLCISFGDIILTLGYISLNYYGVCTTLG